MKLYHIIGLSTAGLLSLASLGFLAQSETADYNTDYRLETLNGDVTTLNGIELENIAKTGKNTYSKVTIVGENATVTPTKYDPYHGADEKVLENRELYRNLAWPETLENDDYLMTANFNYTFYYENTEPTLRIRVKNKETGKIVSATPVLKEIAYNESMMQEYLTQVGDNYYYIIRVFNHKDGADRLLTYRFNPDTLDFAIQNEREFGMSNCILKDELIYSLSYEAPFVLSMTNLISGEEKAYTLVGNFNYPYLDNVITTDSHLYLSIDNVLYEANLDDSNNTITLNVAPAPSFIDSLTTDFEYFYTTGITEANDLIYTMYQAEKRNSSQQYLSVINSKTNDVVYEGKIMLRNDQGLLHSYQLKTVSQD